MVATFIPDSVQNIAEDGDFYRAQWNLLTRKKAKMVVCINAQSISANGRSFSIEFLVQVLDRRKRQCVRCASLGPSRGSRLTYKCEKSSENGTGKLEFSIHYFSKCCWPMGKGINEKVTISRNFPFLFSCSHWNKSRRFHMCPASRSPALLLCFFLNEFGPWWTRDAERKWT